MGFCNFIPSLGKTCYFICMQNISYQKSAIDAPACISNGWNLVKPNYWMYFGIGLLALLMVACVPCVNILIMGPTTAGVYYVLLRAMRSEPVDFGMMFKGFEKFVPTMVVGVIQSIPGMIMQGVQFTGDLGRIVSQITRSRGSSGNFFQASDETSIAIAGGLMFLYLVLVFFFMLFSIAWAITFAFALPLIIEHDLGPIDAIKLSARAGWSNPFGLVFLGFLIFLIAMIGVMAFCIGVFFVTPIIYAAYAFAYRQVFPLGGQAFAQGGGSYGQAV